MHEVHAERDQGQPFLVDRPRDLVDLAPMEQQLPRTEREVATLVALLVGRDVHPLEPQLAVAHAGVAVRERRSPAAQRLHFVTREPDAAFEAVEQFVVVTRAAIARDGLLPLVRAAHGRRGYTSRKRRMPIVPATMATPPAATRISGAIASTSLLRISGIHRTCVRS